MKLTADDKLYLKSLGYPEQDFPQIQKAINLSTFTVIPNKGRQRFVTAEKAVSILGRQKFLSGIGRSAFHYSAVRCTPTMDVYFNSSQIFK